jgi:hypothetical protein
VKTKPELHLIGQIGYFLPRIEHLCKQAFKVFGPKDTRGNKFSNTRVIHNHSNIKEKLLHLKESLPALENITNRDGLLSVCSTFAKDQNLNQTNEIDLFVSCVLISHLTRSVIGEKSEITLFQGKISDWVLKITTNALNIVSTQIIVSSFRKHFLSEMNDDLKNIYCAGVMENVVVPPTGEIQFDEENFQKSIAARNQQQDTQQEAKSTQHSQQKSSHGSKKDSKSNTQPKSRNNKDTAKKRNANHENVFRKKKRS